MSSKRGARPQNRPGDRRGSSSAGTAPRSARTAPASPMDLRTRIGFVVVVVVMVVVVVIGADVAFGAISGGGGGGSPAASPSAVAVSMPTGVIVQGKGGHWTNVGPDGLAAMLTRKDFTLLNVKTPYIGEIDLTDLYIPYDQLAARASELPANKSARILVYCRSGVESAQAAQTLLDLGYSNVWNLDGGMNAWQASGRQLIQKNR